jgi:hypothetical protein
VFRAQNQSSAQNANGCAGGGYNRGIGDKKGDIARVLAQA